MVRIVRRRGGFCCCEYSYYFKRRKNNCHIIINFSLQDVTTVRKNPLSNFIINTLRCYINNNSVTNM